MCNNVKIINSYPVLIPLYPIFLQKSIQYEKRIKTYFLLVALFCCIIKKK